MTPTESLPAEGKAVIIDRDPSCTGRCTSLLFSVVFRSLLHTPQMRSRGPEEGPVLLCHMETWLYLTATGGTAGSPSLKGNNNSAHQREVRKQFPGFTRAAGRRRLNHTVTSSEADRAATLKTDTPMVLFWSSGYSVILSASHTCAV